MARKTGVPTMLAEAQSLNKHITSFQPTIQSIYSSNQDLLDALVAAAACLIPLIQELSAVRERGD